MDKWYLSSQYFLTITNDIFKPSIELSYPSIFERSLKINIQCTLNFVVFCGCCHDSCFTSKEVELSAIIQVQQKAKKLNFFKILIMSDAMLWSYQCNKWGRRLVLRKFCRRHFRVPSCFKSVKFFHISKKFNEATHSPAKFSFGSFEWYISFPVWPNGFSCFGFISF